MAEDQKRYYVCKLIGDGKSTATAIRPALGDVIDPATGKPAFIYPRGWKDNGDGTATVPEMLAAADYVARAAAEAAYKAAYASESEKIDADALVAGNADILSVEVKP